MNTLFNIDAKSLFMSTSSFHPFMCSASKHRTPGPLTSRWMPACIQSGAAAVIRITNHVYLHPTGVSKCLCAFISCFLVHHWHPDEPRGPLREASLSEAGERRVYWLQRGHCFPPRLSCEHMPTWDIGKGWPWKSFVDCDIGRGLKKTKKNPDRNLESAWNWNLARQRILNMRIISHALPLLCSSGSDRSFQMWIRRSEEMIGSK